MEDRKTSWVYNLMETTVDRSGPRPSVSKPNSYELVGVNGQVEGGISPFPGFMEAHVFNPSVSGAGKMAWTGSDVLEFHPFECKVGTEDYAYGFVYRTGSANGGTARILVDHCIVTAGNGSWSYNNDLLGGITGPTQINTTGGKQMSVAVWGRFVYVFVQDESPVVFEFTPAFTKRTQTGPGKRPTLLSPNASVSLGNVPTPTGTRSAAGQIFLTEFFPDEITGVLGTSADFADGPTMGRKEVASLKPGSYAFAYLLVNSNNGLRSALSEIAYAKLEDFDPDGTGSLGPVNLHVAIEIKLPTGNPKGFDQAYIYRSVRVEAAGGTYTAGLLHLDAIINIGEYSGIYFYCLDDRQLVRQDTFVDNIMHDENMPKAGSAAMYESTLLCSNITETTNSSSEFYRPNDASTGLGELRWSSTTESCPELFSPLSKYLPKVPNNSIYSFEQVGPNLMGFSFDRIYLIRKESGMSVYELHSGYGITNSWASETVGTICYFLTNKGLKAIDVQAQLDDVKSINEVIISKWTSDLNRVSVAYDPIMSTLFLVNPVKKETYLFWFNTAKVTSLEDTDFVMCRRGSWPQNMKDQQNQMTSADWAQPLVERCFFLRNPESGDRPVLYVVDYKDQLTQSSGTYASSKRCTLFPFQGDSVFTLSSNKAGHILSCDTSFPSTGVCSGYQVYVLKASNRSLVGKKATVSLTSGSTVTLDSADSSNLNGLLAGDVVGLSPVVVRWVGYPSSLVSDEGIPEDSLNMFRVKHFDSLALSMTDVLNPRSAVLEGIVRALAYRGNDTNPSAIGYTLDTSGGWENALSEYEGVYYAAFEAPSTTVTTKPKYGIDGSCLTPGFQIVYPDATFMVIGVNVTGSIRASLRTRRPV